MAELRYDHPEYRIYSPPTKDNPVGVGLGRRDVPASPLAEDLSSGGAVGGDGFDDITDAMAEERAAQLQYQAMPDANQADQEMEDERNAFLDEQTRTMVTNSGLVNTGPPPAQYNYRGLVEDGGNPQVTGEGGVSLPNKHWNPMTYGIAGRDVATGERVTNRWHDDEGFIEAGVAGIRNSTSNTELGPPIEDIESLASIAYGLQQEGAGVEEYKKQLGDYHSDENIQRAWNATQRVRMREALEEFAVEYGEEAADAIGEPMPPLEETIYYEDLTEHEQWMQAAQILWTQLESQNPTEAPITEGLEGEGMAEPGPLPAQPSPQELSDWLVSTMSNFNWNVSYMAYFTTRVMNGDEAMAQAAFNAMQLYDALDSAPGQTGRAVGYLLADPLTYASFGTGTLAARAASVPLKSVVARVALGGAAGGAFEGGLFMGIDDTMRQTVELEAGERGERDLGQTAKATGMGMGFGATMGGPLAAAASRPARQLYMRAGRRVAENARSVRHMAPGTPMAQTGSIGDQAAGRAHARAEKARQKLAEGKRTRINDLDVMALLETASDHVDAPVPYRDTVDHVRKSLKRAPHVGAPKFAGKVLCDDQGCIELGLPSTEHWLARVNEMLSPEEQAESRHWYETVKPVFEREFGAEGETMMTAWLMSNQNIDPAGALMNALRVSEQVGSGAVGLKGGLSDELVRSFFAGKTAEKGMDLKLHDFIDSALGKEKRTTWGNVAEGGAPAVIDVHSARDMGYIDASYVNYLAERFGVEALNDIGIDATKGTGTVDFGRDRWNKKKEKWETSGSVSATQYEHAARHMRALTDELNAMGYLGGELTPMQVQAIGWTAQARRTGSEAFNAVQSIDRNTRHVSYELSPGTASEFAQRFGERFDALDFAEKSRVTRKVTDHAAGVALSIVRPHESVRFYGPGGYQDYPPMPSAHSTVVSSKEAAQDMADIMGYLLQQTEVFITKPVPNKQGWKAALDIVGPTLGDPDKVTPFWIRLQEVAPELRELGFSPMRERSGEGIRVVFDGGGEKFVAKLEAELGPKIEQVAEEMGLDGIMPAVTKVEAEKRVNKWDEQTNGEGYLAGIESRYGSRVRGALERDHRRNVARLFDEELTKAEGRVAGKGKAKPEAGAEGRLTKAERKFFEEVLGSEGDKAELIEAVPSFEMTKTGYTVAAEHRGALAEYVDETVRLERGEGRRLPPSFHRGTFGGA